MASRVCTGLARLGGLQAGRPAAKMAPMPDQTPVPSPCISVCRMNAATSLCEGCLRTIDEIAAWSRMADPDKRAVWALIDERRRALGAAARQESAR